MLSIRARGKNILITSYLYKIRDTINAALSWIDRQDNHKSYFSNNHSCDNRFLFIWQGYDFRKVDFKSIIYLKASRSYCELHLHGHKKMVVSVPMSEVAKHLYPDIFIRIHRSYVVNLKFISGLVGNNLIMEGGDMLPISKEYRKSVITRFILIGSKSRKYSIYKTVGKLK